MTPNSPRAYRCLLHRPQTRYAVFRQKKKPHRQTSASVTVCFHILPSFTPSQGCAPGSHMVGILALRISEALRLLRLYPAFSGFPNDRIAPLRIQASALTATGIARISTGSLISTPELSQPTQDMGHHAAIQLLKTNFCAILHMETETREAGIDFVKESP